MGLFGRSKKAQTIDPVCGMVLVEAEAIGPDEVDGVAYFYCSTTCQDEHHAATGTRRGRPGKTRERAVKA